MSTAVRELFGGAIVATLPVGLIDASDLRQVPDTQEVLLYPDSQISIVLEVLESVDATEFTDIAKFHFDSLAHDNDAEENTVLDVTQVLEDSNSANLAFTILSGTQLVRKFNTTQPDEIHILMAVYRIKDHNVDLVLTMNVPTRTTDGAGVDEAGLTSARSTFELAARSLRIVNYGLFA